MSKEEYGKLTNTLLHCVTHGCTLKHANIRSLFVP